MFSASLSYFDIAVLGVMALSCIFAFWRGFVKEILSLGAWIGAGLITIYYFPSLAQQLQPHFKSTVVAAGLATLILYITALLLFSMMNAVILRFMKQGSDVGFLDNSLGLFFGAFRGAFILSLAFFVFTMVVPKGEYPGWMENAYTLPSVEKGATYLAQAAPEYLRELSPLGSEEHAKTARVPLFKNRAEPESDKKVDGEQMRELMNRIDTMQGPAR